MTIVMAPLKKKKKKNHLKADIYLFSIVHYSIESIQYWLGYVQQCEDIGEKTGENLNVNPQRCFFFYN